MSSFKPQQFGLILKKNSKGTKLNSKPILKKAAVFDNDNDEDITAIETSQEAKKRVNAQLASKSHNKQVSAHLDQMLEDDPNAFAYDDVYDDMQATKETSIGKKKEERSLAKAKPKYINALLAKSNERKLEYERFVERKVQKEREAEGDQFEGKEKFITGAYKKKLEDIRRAEEDEKRRAAIEEKEDARKQGDMSNFYRGLLNSKSFGGEVTEEKTVASVADKATKNIGEVGVRKHANEVQREYKITRDNSASFDKSTVRSGRERETIGDEQRQVISKRQVTEDVQGADDSDDRDHSHVRRHTNTHTSGYTDTRNGEGRSDGDNSACGQRSSSKRKRSQSPVVKERPTVQAVMDAGASVSGSTDTVADVSIADISETSKESTARDRLMARRNDADKVALAREKALTRKRLHAKKRAELAVEE
eukprot:CFRG5383T1